jgi:hypothetical protein
MIVLIGLERPMIVLIGLDGPMIILIGLVGVNMYHNLKFFLDYFANLN